ncbi:MAG: IPT/TIG domain-containing protein, partial [Candidatus Hydrogenedentes bacterium]|nr:IPT/TIG domain-containing protein [Candidatus Hydrogenedentota bacterium]
VVQGDDVAITNVLPSQLPKVVGGGGLTLSITGQNFGTSPIVTLDGVALTVVSATNTQILATIPGGITLDSDNNNVVTLKVTNSTSGQFDTYNGFTVVPGGGGNAPTITSINPSSGGQTAFPVTITGTNFDDPKVFFGGTVMPINSWTPTSIVVGFPVGGLPVTGPLDVTVQNQGTGLFAVAPDGFNYINNPGGGGGGGGFQGGGGLPTCFIATAAYGSPLAGKLDTFREFRDAVLLKTAVGAALVDLYYTVSPPLADHIAAHPAIAAAVRLALTPVAWSLESPVLALTTFLLLLAGAWTARRRWSAVRA